jgi:hypothetical protein
MSIKNKIAHCLYDCVGQYAENAWTLIVQNIVRGNFQNPAQDRKRKAAFNCSFYCQSIFCNGVLNLDDWAFAGFKEKGVTKRKHVTRE